MWHILISRAKPRYTDDYIDWELPIARGNALIHAYHVANGEPMIWPQIERSELGRSFSRLAARIAAKRKELGLDDIEPNTPSELPTGRDE